jgi:hypothetical protein
MLAVTAVTSSQGATDWWARGTAIAGLIIGLAGFILAARREWQMRQRTAAKVRVNGVYGPGGREKLSEVFTVTIRNRGRPVTVENVGIDFVPHRDDGVGLMMVPLDATRVALLDHFVLADGEAKSMRFHVTALTARPRTEIGETATVCAVISLSTREKPIRSKGVSVALWTAPPPSLPA